MATHVITSFLIMLAGLVATKLAIAYQMHFLEDPDMKALQTVVADKDQKIRQLEQDCVAREARAYRQCGGEIIRTVILGGWVVKRLEEREKGKAIAKAIEQAV